MRNLLLILFLLPVSASAGFNQDSVGTSSGEFLKFGADARGIAMGSAMTAAADDASAIYWNPAGLSQLNQRHMTFTHHALFEGVNYEFAAYAHPVTPLVPTRRREYRPSGRGTLAAAILYLNAGRLQEVDNTGLKTGGAFTPRDLAIVAGWGAKMTDVLDIGIALKYIDSRIISSARTGAIDAGMRLNYHLAQWPYALAFNIRNMGGQLTFRDQRDPLPLNIRVGQSLRPHPNWLLTSDIVFPRDNDWYAAFGSEVTFSRSDMELALRGGWNGRTNSGDLDGFSAISFGSGISFHQFGLDYAWLPFGILGNTHRLTLAYRF
jgi:hypothetical protein